jgi:hypothetical protein
MALATAAAGIVQMHRPPARCRRAARPRRGCPAHGIGQRQQGDLVPASEAMVSPSIVQYLLRSISPCSCAKCRHHAKAGDGQSRSIWGRLAHGGNVLGMATVEILRVKASDALSAPRACLEGERPQPGSVEPQCRIVNGAGLGSFNYGFGVGSLAPSIDERANLICRPGPDRASIRRILSPAIGQARSQTCADLLMDMHAGRQVGHSVPVIGSAATPIVSTVTDFL